MFSQGRKAVKKQIACYVRERVTLPNFAHVGYINAKAQYV
jgi:hypothetical protein